MKNETIARNGSTANIELTVDRRTARVPEGATLLEAARQVGIDIPVLCYHETLEPIGACRVCAVEVEGSRVLQPACQRKAEAGMVVHTDTERVRTSQRMVVELLQTGADTSRAPDIQHYARQFNTDPDRWEAFSEEGGLPNGRVAQEPIIDNELYVRDPDRCIMCYRCVEACGEQVQNTFAIAASGRGYEAYIDAGFHQSLPDSACVFCGNCVAVCPTDALIFATEFEMRENGTWDEDEQTVTRTTCPYCGVGCQVELHVQDNRIVKATAPVEDPITSGYLCVKGRFGWEYVHAGVGDDGPLDSGADDAYSKERGADGVSSKA